MSPFWTFSAYISPETLNPIDASRRNPIPTENVRDYTLNENAVSKAKIRVIEVKMITQSQK